LRRSSAARVWTSTGFGGAVGAGPALSTVFLTSASMSSERKGGATRNSHQCTPETVFGLLTDPAHMKIRLAELVEADPWPGEVFHTSGPAGANIEGTYSEIIANRKVAWRVSSPGNRPSSSCSNLTAGAQWSACATTNCRNPLSRRIGAAGATPDWSNSGTPPRGARPSADA